MYVPEFFAENRQDEIARIIERFPLATLITHTESGLQASHLPLLADGTERLIGHIALNNDLHRILADGAEILAVFRADDAYVSPNWYPGKNEHHRVVPTWNYQAVHVAGTIHFRHDEKTKRAIVGRLTQHFEAATGAARPWRMADAPRDYLDDMLARIVGFEIAVSEITAKSKLSQNRNNADFESVAAEFDARDKSNIASAMRRIDRSD